MIPGSPVALFPCLQPRGFYFWNWSIGGPLTYYVVKDDELLPLSLVLGLTRGMDFYTQFRQCWGLNPGLGAPSASTLPNNLHP